MFLASAAFNATTPPINQCSRRLHPNCRVLGAASDHEQVSGLPKNHGAVLNGGPLFVILRGLPCDIKEGIRGRNDHRLHELRNTRNGFDGWLLRRRDACEKQHNAHQKNPNESSCHSQASNT